MRIIQRKAITAFQTSACRKGRHIAAISFEILCYALDPT